MATTADKKTQETTTQDTSHSPSKTIADAVGNIPAPSTVTPAPAAVTRATKTKVYCKLPHGIAFTIDDIGLSLKGGLDKNAVAGFGITEVDAELWEVIAKRYAKHPSIVNQLIFARAVDGESQAEELKGEKTGLEGLDPNKPVSGVEPFKGEK